MDAFYIETHDTVADLHADTGNTRSVRRIATPVAPSVDIDAWYHQDAVATAKPDTGHPFRWTAANVAR